MNTSQKANRLIPSFTADGKLDSTNEAENEGIIEFCLASRPFPNAVDVLRFHFKTPPFFKAKAQVSGQDFRCEAQLNVLSATGLFLIYSQQLHFYNGDSLLSFSMSDAATVFGGESKQLGKEVKDRQKELCFDLPDQVKVQGWNRIQNETIISPEVLQNLEKSHALVRGESLPIRAEYTPKFFAARHGMSERNVIKRMKAWATRHRYIDYAKEGGRWRITDPTFAQSFDDSFQRDRKKKS